MGELLGRFFVIFVTLLICFIGYSSQIFVIWPWYGRELSVELITLLVPFKWVLASNHQHENLPFSHSVLCCPWYCGITGSAA